MEAHIFFDPGDSDLDYITLYYPYSKNSDKSLKLLIDNGAAISLVKASSLSQFEITDSQKIMLSGITRDSPVFTLGETHLEFQINDKTIKSNFQIIHDQTNVPFDGLIGRDFIKKHKCIPIIHESTFVIESLATSIPIYTNTPQHSNTHTIIQPRTEMIMKIQIVNPHKLHEGIISSQKLNNDDSLLIPNAMVKIDKNNEALITVVNVSTKTKIIPKPQLCIQEMPKQATVFHMGEINQSNHKNRIELLNQNLRLSHTNKEQFESITKICNDFEDIFHLPGDQLTKTTAATCEIKTTDDIPIHTKAYRYPEIHKDEVKKQTNKLYAQGSIRPSTSPWSSPLIIVPKKVDASGEKKWRMVIDYRPLNDKTIGDAYPLPNIEDILDQLGHSQFFTTLDLASGFHQIPIKTEDRPKTAFSTPEGHWEWDCMPFGLKNAPATFQRMMNNVLSGLNNKQCFVYLDDIVIYGSNLEDHNQKLINVFTRLRDNTLKLQPDKCEFLRDSCQYLGHIITRDGVKPNPDKVSSIKQIPIPKNPKHIKMFLGMTGYYRKFIKDFASIAKPLTNLLKKDAEFIWKNEQQIAFETLKNALIKEPLLQYPKFTLPFTLTCDASNVGIGGVLSQIIDGKDLPVAYYSRTLNKAEQNYTTTEKELLAIVNSIEKFRPYLYGRIFTIYTDHKALTWLFNCKNPASKLVRWRLRLNEYQYTIKYKPGRINSNADGLSRLFPDDQIETEVESPPQNIFITHKSNKTYQDFIQFHYKNEEIIEYEKENRSLSKIQDRIVMLWSEDLDENNQYSDYVKSNFDTTLLKSSLNGIFQLKNGKQTLFLLFPLHLHFDKTEYKNIFECFMTLKDSIGTKSFTLIPPDKAPNIKPVQLNEMLKFIFPKNEIKIFNTAKITPKNQEEVKTILIECHNSKLSGHYGFNKTYSKIKERYNWTNMKSDIRKYIKNCHSCQLNKTNFKPTKQPMEITTTAEAPFERIAFDVVGPLPLTESGNRFIITTQDDLTKFSFAFATPNHEAKTIANRLTTIFTSFGIPKTYLTDQGADFMSNLMKELSALFKTKHLATSPYHPQTNGALERSHLTLKDYLKHYIKDNQTDWDEYLPFATFSYNTSVHKSTNYTPYELLFGKKAYLPSSIVQEPKLNYTYDDYIKSLQSKLNTSFKIARENITHSKLKSKENYDRDINPIEFAVNELVCLRNNQGKLGLSRKLLPNAKGPYKITQVFPNQTVQIQIGKKKVTYHTNHLKRYFTDESDNSDFSPDSLLR